VSSAENNPAAPEASTAPAEAGQRMLVLKKNEERRLAAGHLWVYSNEVDKSKSPLKSFDTGEQVPVYSSRGKFIGMACVNSHSLICARLYSYRRSELLDADLIHGRLATALAHRERCYAEPYYRLVHGEGDWLPGLVVDRYGDYLVVQTNTAGMDAVREAVVEALVRLLSPAGVYLRNSSAARQLEGLDSSDEIAHGEVPETVEIQENGIRYQIPLTGGQKTGWFYDHRDNRQTLQRFCKGARVLDAYCYLGGWGLNALAAGAEHVTAIDSSAAALEGAQRNAELNGFGERWRGLQGDATEQLRHLRQTSEKYDVIILDPPAFIKRAKDKKAGLEMYRRINSLAMGMLQSGGLLVSGSCSYHLTEIELQRVMLHGSQGAGRTLQIVARGHQALDHPVHGAIAETEYLKALFGRLIH
jgi:23S rRNA (cytosine1962-C5)-methyltransferase